MATQLKAQLPWTTRLGSKTILKTTEEDEGKNVIQISDSQFGNTNLTLSYRPASDEKAWKRTVLIYDTADNSIAKNPVGLSIKGSRTFTVNNKLLKELLANHKKVIIYFTSLPSDPGKADVVRVRRVHLCTLLAK